MSTTKVTRVTKKKPLVVLVHLVLVRF